MLTWAWSRRLQSFSLSSAKKVVRGWSGHGGTAHEMRKYENEWAPLTTARLILHLTYLWCHLVVDNLLKYTGYGNAAGLLVARGLLAGGRGETQYSEDEDSDTEEYKSAKPLCVLCHVNMFNTCVCFGNVQIRLQLCIELVLLLVPASTQSLVMWRSRCRTPSKRWQRNRKSTKLRNLSICLTSCQGNYTKQERTLQEISKYV